ncbi:MAG: hypothetical protein HZB38_08160 [Planctomycetes bacterium]|nr:hypothetical protein [Planctomycetota bacterium]
MGERNMGLLLIAAVFGLAGVGLSYYVLVRLRGCRWLHRPPGWGFGSSRITLCLFALVLIQMALSIFLYEFRWLSAEHAGKFLVPTLFITWACAGADLVIDRT